ncbi:MBL fold metallo-hydrolase [Oxalobacteraceae bacterium OM1]|nr:MBL fold metallo-hydrolase [Oxalobacteraceae bacterium OM1]
MKFTNIGGATALLEHKGVRILFDPWMDDGIFHGSWYHYPPVAMPIEQLGHIDYIYISHIHEDHCSAGTLAHINRDAEILLMDREPNLVARFLQANKLHFRKIHLIKPRNPEEIVPGLIVDMVEPDPSDEMARLIDSSLLIAWDGFIIYNANDCQPYAEGMRYIRERYGKVDLALLPYSGGSGYPSCYINLSDEEKLAEKNRIMNMRFASFIDSVRNLQPLFVVPFADQYAIAGSRADLNRFISHPPCPGAVVEAFEAATLPSRLLLLNSAQSFDFSTECKSPDAAYVTHSDEDREAYIATKRTDAIYDHERLEFGPSVPVLRLLESARARLWQMQERKNYYPDFHWYFDTPDSGERFHLALSSPTVTALPPGTEYQQPFLRISMPRTLFILMLMGHVSWNIADAALFLDYERVPNRYDPMIYAFLNYLRI